MLDTLSRLTSALADRYSIEHVLGEGGMAVVYLAEDRKVGRKVAVKVLRPELAAALGPDRFLREIEIGGKLSHPNVLPIFDSGEADGFLYYVMPVVEGESLRDRLNRETQLPVDDAVQITKEVADALGHSHAHGIMHRDVKPENILLSGDHAVVADFGIARAVAMAGGEKLTQTGMAVGTPAYMSPEQATGTKNVDHRTDIYALACVTYEMLAGEAPYTGPTAQAIIAKRFSDPVPSVRRVRKAVSEEVDAAIVKALDTTPADRFESTEQFVQALTGERPVRSSTRSSRRVGTKRWVGSAVAGAVLVGAGVALRTIVGANDAPEPVTVVMASTTAEGADSTLASAIDIALVNAMLESPHVTMLSPREIQLAFEAVDREPDPTLDENTALELARRAGAAAVVQPSVLSVGAGYTINVRVLEPDGAALAVAQASADGEADLLAALDSLQIDVRRKLGESRRDLEDSRSLLYVITPSADAFALYVQSETFTDRTRQLPLLEQALALDSNFALASLAMTARQDIGLDFLSPIERLARTADHLPAAYSLAAQVLEASLAERDFEKTVERVVLALDVLPSTGLGAPRVLGGFYSVFANALHELGNFDRASTVFVEWRDSVRTGGALGPLQFLNSNNALNAAQQGDSAGTYEMLERATAAQEGLTQFPFMDGLVSAAGGRWSRAAGAFGQTLEIELPSEVLFLAATYLGTAEAVRGRPRASRVAFARAQALAQATGLPDLIAAGRVLRADAEFFVLKSPDRASAALAPLLAGTPPDSGTGRRYHARGRAIAAAICAALEAAPREGPAVQLACGQPVATDSIHDTIETLERLGWEALDAGQFDRAVAIGREPRLARAGGVGLRARLPAALAWERQGNIDSATIVFEQLAATPWGFLTNAQSSFAMRSYGLQLLAAMQGEHGRAARETLREWWADAEPEFQQRVVEPLLGTGR